MLLHSRFLQFLLGCAASRKAVLRYWQGLASWLAQNLIDSLERMLTEHAAQTRVFKVFVNNRDWK